MTSVWQSMLCSLFNQYSQLQPPSMESQKSEDSAYSQKLSNQDMQSDSILLWLLWSECNSDRFKEMQSPLNKKAMLSPFEGVKGAQRQLIILLK